MKDRAEPEVERHQLHHDAARWFARMRGPDAELHKAAFETWLALGAIHLGAYNRVAEVFAAGKLLKRPLERRRRRHVVAVSAVGALGAVIALIVAGGRLPRAGSDGMEMTQQRTLESFAGQVRRVALVDRSIVTLDSNTLVSSHFERKARILNLERGRARFDVRHDGRSFVVIAGGTRVVARGTLFDVAFIGRGMVEVSLYRGSVDVTAAASGLLSRSKPMSLVPGQHVVSVAGAAFASPAPITERRDWTLPLPMFDRVPLAEIVRSANGSSGVRIEIPDPAVARLTVSGAFRVEDAASLSERLGRLFNLDVDKRMPGVVVLRRKPVK